MGLMITSKYGLFSIFQHDVKFSQSTTVVFTVASGRKDKSSNRDSGYRVVVLEISKAFYII